MKFKLPALHASLLHSKVDLIPRGLCIFMTWETQGYRYLVYSHLLLNAGICFMYNPIPVLDCHHPSKWASADVDILLSGLRACVWFMLLSTPVSTHHDWQVPSCLQALSGLQENLWLLPTPGSILKHLLCILNNLSSVHLPSRRTGIRERNVSFYLLIYPFMPVSKKEWLLNV